MVGNVYFVVAKLGLLIGMMRIEPAILFTLQFRFFAPIHDRLCIMHCLTCLSVLTLYHQTYFIFFFLVMIFFITWRTVEDRVTSLNVCSTRIYHLSADAFRWFPVAEHFCPFVQIFPPKAVTRHFATHLLLVKASEWPGPLVWLFGPPGLRTSSQTCSLTPAQAYAQRWDLSPVPRSTLPIVPRREASLDTPASRTNNTVSTSNHVLPSQTSKQPTTAQLRNKTHSLDCGFDPTLYPKSGPVLPCSAPPCTLPPSSMPILDKPAMPLPDKHVMPPSMPVLDPPPSKLSTNPRPSRSTNGL